MGLLGVGRIGIWGIGNGTRRGGIVLGRRNLGKVVGLAGEIGFKRF